MPPTAFIFFCTLFSRVCPSCRSRELPPRSLHRIDLADKRFAAFPPSTTKFTIRAKFTTMAGSFIEVIPKVIGNCPRCASADRLACLFHVWAIMLSSTMCRWLSGTWNVAALATKCSMPRRFYQLINDALSFILVDHPERNSETTLVHRFYWRSHNDVVLASQDEILSGCLSRPLTPPVAVCAFNRPLATCEVRPHSIRQFALLMDAPLLSPSLVFDHVERRPQDAWMVQCVDVLLDGRAVGGVEIARDLGRHGRTQVGDFQEDGAAVFQQCRRFDFKLDRSPAWARSRILNSIASRRQVVSTTCNSTAGCSMSRGRRRSFCREGR